MEWLTLLLLLYQVTMPSVDNAKFTFGEIDNQIIRMNTQNGSFDICDRTFVCKAVDNTAK